MTSVHAASLKSVKKGQLYMPFSIRLSKVFKLNKGLGYKCMALQRVFAGFCADDCAPKAKDLKSNEKLWDLSVEFCKENGMSASSDGSIERVVIIFLFVDAYAGTVPSSNYIDVIRLCVILL